MAEKISKHEQSKVELGVEFDLPPEDQNWVIYCGQQHEVVIVGVGHFLRGVARYDIDPNVARGFSGQFIVNEVKPKKDDPPAPVAIGLDLLPVDMSTVKHNK